MKILYITNGIGGAGGLERVLAIKASYLAEHKNHEVHILTLNQNPDTIFYEFSPKVIYHNIVVNGNPLRYILQYSRGMKSVVNKIKPDVISVCDDGLKGFFLPIILSKPCPMIYERHVSKIISLGPNPGFVKRMVSGFKFSLMNFLAKRYDRFVVLTNDNLPEWNLNNAIVIPNPLSFYPQESSSLEDKKVLAVGKQGFQKGYDRLLKSWEIVNDKHPDWILEIYGKHDASEKLGELAKQLNIENSVRFFDPVKDIEKKYLETSIYVMSSRFEGFGMVLTEAMACGVPCISFNCPCGPSDIISHGTDGFLIENGDTEIFAKAIQTLIENDDLRKEMGQRAKENARRFLPEIIVGEWDTLFKSLQR